MTWIYAAFVPLLWMERGRLATSRSQIRRHVSLTVRVDTLRDGVRDDTLARPLLLTANGTRVYDYDYGRVSAIDSREQLLWRAGRRGHGLFFCLVHNIEKLTHAGYAA